MRYEIILNENRYKMYIGRLLKEKSLLQKQLLLEMAPGSIYGVTEVIHQCKFYKFSYFAAERFHILSKITLPLVNPRLIEIPETIEQKVRYVESFGECANTDISKVYELLLNVAKSKQVKPKDMVAQVIIISDMEFDYCVRGKSTFETYKEKFAELGLEMPQLVFWNVEARSIHTPVTENELGVKLVSGSSQKILDRVVSNKINCTPYEFMIEDLARYSEVDSFKL